MNGSRGNPAWPAAAGAVARRGAPPAASPSAVYPFFSRLNRVFLRAVSLQQQEAVGQQRQRRVVVEATPRPTLEMVQAEFLLQLLVALFHRPATLPQPHREERRARGTEPKWAKRRTAHGSGLGVFRWVAERTLSWLHGFRKLRLVTEKNLDMQYAFLTLAVSVICYRYLSASFC